MIENTINTIDGIVLNFVQSAFGGLSGPISTLWTSMFIVFIAIYGYRVMISGRFNGPDLIVHCLKIVVLLALATQWDLFFTYIYAMVTDLPDDLAGQILVSVGTIGGAAQDVDGANSALQGFYDRGMQSADRILDAAGFRDIGLYFYAAAVWFGTIGVAGYAGMLIILAKLAVAVLLAIGPIFIILLMFASTRALFEGWMRALLNYAIVPVFIYVLLALLLTIIESPLVYLESEAGATGEIGQAVGPFLLVSVISLLLLAQIMNMASAVTGGISLSTMGLFRYAAGRPAQRGAQAAGGFAGRQGARGAKWAGGKFKGGAGKIYGGGRKAVGQALSRAKTAFGRGGETK